MLEFRCVKQFSFFVKIDQNVFIRILYKFAGVRCVFCQLALAVYKLYKRKIIVTSDIRIIFTECRCNVYDTCTV